MTTLFNLTYFSFLACGVAAFLAVVYFVTQLPRLTEKLRILAILNIVICGVSCALHLYFFSQLEPVAAGHTDIPGMAAAISGLPLAVRYGYWLATTLILISMFPLLMGIERVGFAFARKLALTDAGMIVTGYLGEHATMAGGGGWTVMGLFWFSVSGALFAYLTLSIFMMLRRLPSHDMVPAQRDGLAYMFFFFLIGWAIFPAGFFYAIVFDPGIGAVLRELTVNVGDIVNKIIWGVLVVYAAVEISKNVRAEGGR